MSGFESVRQAGAVVRAQGSAHRAPHSGSGYAGSGLAQVARDHALHAADAHRVAGVHAHVRGHGTAIHLHLHQMQQDVVARTLATIRVLVAEVVVERDRLGLALLQQGERLSVGLRPGPVLGRGADVVEPDLHDRSSGELGLARTHLGRCGVARGLPRDRPPRPPCVMGRGQDDRSQQTIG